jgi:hypothetical protein
LTGPAQTSCDVIAIAKAVGAYPSLRSAGSAIDGGWLMLGSLGRLVNYSRTALSREVPPDPLNGDEKALLEIDEEIHVDECPKQPGRPAFQRPFSKVEDGGVPADHCRIAAVLELKTWHGSSRS